MSNQYLSSSKSTNSWTVALMSSNTSPRYSKSRTRTNWSSSFSHGTCEDALWLTTTTEFQFGAVWKPWMNLFRMSLRFWRGQSAGGIVVSWGSFWTCSSFVRTRLAGSGWRHTFGTPKGSRWKQDGVSDTRLDAVTSRTGQRIDSSSVIALASWTSLTTAPSSWTSKAQSY